MDLTFPNSIFTNSLFGCDAILTTSQPSRIRTIRVLFHRDFSVDVISDFDYEGKKSYAEANDADVVNARASDTLTVNSVVYNILSIQKQENGFTNLILGVSNG